jgi:inner membrane protein YidH
MDDAGAEEGEQLRKQTAELKRSARAVEQSMDEFADSADRRTILAGDRTLLATERTYAAWVRTALASLAAGVGSTTVFKEALPKLVGHLIGSVLVIFAGVCLIAAVWRELRGTPITPHPDIKPIPSALLVPMNFFLLLVAIAALIGIWLA